MIFSSMGNSLLLRNRDVSGEKTYVSHTPTNFTCSSYTMAEKRICQANRKNKKIMWKIIKITT